jgi:hypothetical protein
MKKILVLLLAFILAAPVLPAASANITAIFRVLALGGSLDGLYYYTGGAYKPIKATANSLLNTSYRYTGAPTMELFRRNPQRDPQNPYVHAGTVSFPAVSGNYLALLVPAAEIAGQGIPDSSASFGMGQVRLVNATGLPLSLDLNAQKFVLNAGEFKVMSKPADTNRCELHVSVPKGDAQMEVASNVFGLNAQTKTSLYMLLMNGTALKQNPGTPPAIQIFSTLETATSAGRTATDDPNTDGSGGGPSSKRGGSSASPGGTGAGGS